MTKEMFRAYIQIIGNSIVRAFELPGEPGLQEKLTSHDMKLGLLYGKMMTAAQEYVDYIEAHCEPERK